MITWTDSAQNRLETHLARIRATTIASGADPVEVTDDIRRHVAEDIARSKLEVVTTEDVDCILKRIGAPETMALSNFSPPRPLETPKPVPPQFKPRHGFLLFFGVILPLITLAAELATHMCAAAFFDPIPDLWHVLLVLSVPVINFLSWWAVRECKLTWRRPLGLANAFALGIGIYYSLLFATLTPFAIIGILFFGWGLLPLSPLFGSVAAWWLRVLLRGLSRSPETARWPNVGWGLGVAAAALAFIALPIVMTRHWSNLATSEVPAERNAGVKWLRTFGHERTLLVDCYAQTRWAAEGPLGLHLQGRPVQPEQARNIYYRVTGRPFNTVAPPQLAFSLRRWDFLDEFAWDAEQGGTKVGGRVKGLSLVQSRLDSLIDADAAWSYTEWTLEFKNVSQQQREARSQIALPPGGVVSRLTLWVNGEEREAAFAGNTQVRAAYQEVVRVQRRDPVLVTYCGPDGVLMQCFPVPPNGGTIKVRLGVTAPLQLDSAESALARWPHFIERNFAVPDGVEHSVWVESRQALPSTPPNFKANQSKPGVFALRGQLTDTDLAEPRSTVRIRRTSDIANTWVEDPRSNDGHIIRQSVRTVTERPPERIVLVVDAAKSMNDFLPDIASAIEHLPAAAEFSLLLAKDGVEEFSGALRKGDAAFYQQIAKRLEKTKGVGGQDNLPALIRAWDLAAERAASAVVWIHGPQPMLLENNEALKQRLDWRSAASGATAPVLYDLQTGSGPNRVLEKLVTVTLIKPIARAGTVTEDLGRLFGSWHGDGKSFELARERFDAGALPVTNRGKQSSKHLARLWAYDEVLRLLTANQRDQAVQLAGKYQLVTPVSGAVVLETKEQFQRAGLQPVDANSVPTVPEPGTIVLLALGLAFVGAIHLRRRLG